MSAGTLDILPTRLNSDAIVFCGCTMKELQKLLMAALFGSIVVMGFTAKLLIGMFLIGVAVAFPATVMLAWFGALVLQRIKQGKPKGYVKQKWQLLLEDCGMKQTRFIRRSGRWSLGRKDHEKNKSKK